MKKSRPAILTIVPRSLSAALILLAAFAPGLRAGLVESFEYVDGLLGTVSGGTWERWDPGVNNDGDAVVVNGAAVFVRGTDVIRTFPPVLTALGQTATFSCNLRIATGASSESYELWMVPASGSFYSSNTNYGSGLGLNIGRVTAPANMASLEVSEGSGINSGNINGNNNPPAIGSTTRGETHAIRIELLRGAANISYSLYVDNNLLRTSTFVLNDSRGINAMEFAASGSPALGTVIDDITVVPGGDSNIPLQTYAVLYQWNADAGWQGRNGLVAGADGALYGTSGGGAGGLGFIYRITAAGEMTTLASFSGTGGLNKGADPAGRLLFDGGNFYGTTQNGGASNRGTVFRITPAGALTTLVQFSGNGAVSKGATPRAGVVRGSDGNYYGTTSDGGANNFGTVFNMTPAGVLTTLVEFTGNGAGNKGLNPQGGLTTGSDGNFYGTTTGGGADGFGTVFRMTPAGALTTLAEFTNNGFTNKGANPLAGLVGGSGGNWYGTTAAGGASGAGTVFRITSGGSLTTLVEFSGGGGIPNGSIPQTGLTLGSNGNFYGTTSAGGAHDYGTLYEMTPEGVVTTLVHFSGVNGTAPGASPQFGPLLFGPDGHLYGTTQSGGSGNGGVIFRLQFGPTCVTLPASLVTLASATLRGTLNPNGNVTAASFEYGTDPALAGATVVAAGFTTTGNSPEPVSAAVSGLNPATTYYFRIRGTNQDNLTIQSGAILSFTTFSVQRAHELIASFDAPPKKPSSRLVAGSDGYYWGTTESGGGSGFGTIYKVKADGSDWRKVFSFRAPGNREETAPSGGLVNDGAGFLWGTTRGDYFSYYDHGTIFKINAITGDVTTMVRFFQSVGANPFAGLVSDGAGSFWGTTRAGGASDSGTVFKINASTGVLTTLVQFTGTSGSSKGKYPMAGLVSDGGGAFWGTTSEGGGFNAGTVFKVNAGTGLLTTITEFTYNGDSNKGAYPTAELVRDGAGLLWGTTSRGGNAGFGTVFRITPGGTLTTVVQFSGNAATNQGAYPLAGLVSDGAGFLWGTTAGRYIAEIFEKTDIRFGTPLNNGTVFKVNAVTGELTTMAAFSGDGALNNGRFPASGLIRDSAGFFMGTTAAGGARDSGTVFRLNPATGSLTTLADFSHHPLSNAGKGPSNGVVRDYAGFLWGTTWGGGAGGFGTVFKVHPETGAFATLVQFTGNGPANKGSRPNGELLSDGLGSFWGTTNEGGSQNSGTVFKIAAATGVLTTIVEFSDGGSPMSGLTIDGNGFLWGTTTRGGGSGNGSVFKINPANGALTTLVALGGIRGGFPSGTLASDGGQFLWGTAQSGGLDFGTVFKINVATGSLTTVVYFGSGGNKGSTPVAGLLWDGNGYFYGTTLEGGTGQGGTVFKVNASTGILTTLFEFYWTGSDYRGSSPWAGLVRGSDGNFYGTTTGGVNGYGTVFKITPGGILTTLLNFTGPGSRAGTGAGPSGPLLIGPDGHLYGTTGGGGPDAGGTVFRLRLGPSPLTLPASLITLTAATLNGTLNPNGLASEVTFEYGTNAALAGATVLPAGTTTTGEFPEPVSARLTGLLPQTTYYYRVRGLNPENSHVQSGAILSFSTSGSAGYRDWAAGFGLSGGNAAADADPDSDGLTNKLEFVFGTNPSVPDASSVSAAVVDDTHFVFRFSRADASETPDVTLTVETGTNLVTWPASFTIKQDTASSSPGVTIIENGAAPDTVSVMIPVLRESGSAKFARLAVVVTP